MKKSKLIKLLNELDGDPDILLWNGHVGDWMDIKSELVETELVRETFQGYLTALQNERICRMRDFEYTIPETEIPELKKQFQSFASWELNNYITDEDIKERRYKLKKVRMLEPKLRNRDSDHRGFSISY